MSKRWAANLMKQDASLHNICFFCLAAHFLTSSHLLHYKEFVGALVRSNEFSPQMNFPLKINPHTHVCPKDGLPIWWNKMHLCTTSILLKSWHRSILAKFAGMSINWKKCGNSKFCQDWATSALQLHRCHAKMHLVSSDWLPFFCVHSNRVWTSSHLLFT